MATDSIIRENLKYAQIRKKRVLTSKDQGKLKEKNWR